LKSAFSVAFVLMASTLAAQPRPASPVGAPFLGGVPTGTVTSETVPLTILDAINRALAHNLGLLEAEANLGRARGLC
jgi:hypothetical protein